MVDVFMNSEPKIADSGKAKTKRFWLVKFAPFRTSWTEIVRRGTFTLRGVRSPLACRHLSEMRLGDPVLYYHSQQELAIVGVMEVTREAYPDPTSADPRWLTCDFAPVTTLAQPVSLTKLKADARFESLALIRQPRLAVMPLSESQFKDVLETGK
jgi:predicted RNA-binding protein with PUA-like domain